ncbi:hypothetical protein LINPERPRIM_LOCUS36483 [Linum perenne]
MGNCQAVDAATLVIQHPNGKVENLYWSVTAAEVMKTNPGHCVALLLSTTLYPPPPTAAANQHHRPLPPPSSAAGPVRLTRIKLLRPTDTLTLGHAYRLITNQEVMKGLRAKKQSKLSQTHIVESSEADKQRKQSCSSTQPLLSSDESTSRRSRSSHMVKKKEQSRTESRCGSRNGGSSSSISEGSGSGSGRLRASSWQPSLHSILESAAGGSNSGI